LPQAPPVRCGAYIHSIEESENPSVSQICIKENRADFMRSPRRIGVYQIACGPQFDTGHPQFDYDALIV
jgi:hypothetical protein